MDTQVAYLSHVPKECDVHPYTCPLVPLCEGLSGAQAEEQMAGSRS